MDARQPSQTADGAAIMRALHQQLPAEARVLDDPIAAMLVDAHRQYLAPDALEATLAFVLSMPRASEIVFSIVLPDHLLPGDEAALAATYAARFAAIGEPWLTRPGPDELVARLRSMGFSQAVHLTPEEANGRYFSNRTDGLKASLQEQMIRAVV